MAKELKSFRLSDDVCRILKEQAGALNISEAQIVEIALRKMAEIDYSYKDKSGRVESIVHVKGFGLI